MVGRATASDTAAGTDPPAGKGGEAGRLPVREPEAAHRPVMPGARGAGELAQPPGGADAGLGLNEEGACAPGAGGGGAPVAPGGAAGGRSAKRPSPARRWLSAAWRVFRKIAMIGPSYEEARRMEEEDRRANTEWLPGGRIGLIHGFSEFGARRDD